MMHTLIRLTFIVFVAAISGAATPALAQDEAAKSRLVQFVEGQLSTPDRQIRLNGLRGTLSSNVQLQSITLADRDGIWLTIEEPQLTWDRGQLFSGRLVIERLAATRIDITRSPAPGPDRPDMQAQSFEVPELPVAVQIGALEVERVSLAQELLGEAAELAVEGRLALEGGGLDTQLAINRLDGPGGTFQLTAAYAPDTNIIAVDTRFVEPPGGVLASALGVTGEPALAFQAIGEGPADNLTVDIRLDADDDTVVAGAINTTRQRGATRIRTDIRGRLAPLVSPRMGDFFADESAIIADILALDDGGIDAQSFSLSTAEASVSGSLKRDADGTFTDANLDIRVAGEGGETVALPFADGGMVRGFTADIDYDHDRRQAFRAGIALDEFRSGDVGVGRANILATGILRRAADTTQTVDFSLSGDVTAITLPDPAFNALVETGINLQAAGAWQEDNPLTLETAEITSDGWALEAGGLIEGTTFNGDVKALIDELAAFAPLLGFEASGDADLTLSGSFDAVSGGFDVDVVGETQLASNANAAVANLLRGQTAIDGRVVRDETGTRFDGLSVVNTQLTASVDGLLSPDGSDLDIDAQLTDIGDVKSAGSGAVQLNGNILGAGPKYRAELTVAMPSGRVSGYALQNIEAAFSGQLGTTEIDGAVRLDGRIAGDQVAGGMDVSVDPDRQSAQAIDLRYAGAQVSGDVIRNATSGLLSGDLALTARDISRLARLAGQSASGAIAGDITLSAGANAGQTVAIDINASGLASAGIRAQAASINGRITQLFGAPQIGMEINANGLGSNVFAAQSLSTRLSGPLTRLALNGQVRSASTPQVTSAGVDPVDVTFDALYADAARTLRLNTLSATNPQGLDVTTIGTIALRTNTLSLQVDGSAPLAIASGALESRGAELDGRARFSLTVAGNTSAPVLNGLVSVADGNLRDPLSNLEVSDINLLAGLSGNAVQIQQLRGRIGDGGRVEGSGSIGLSADLPAQLAITLSGVPYSDGQTFSTTLSGDLALRGSLARAPQLSGTINLARTEILVPDVLGAAPDLIEVEHIAPGAGAQTTLDRIDRVTPSSNGSSNTSPLTVDLTVTAPGQIFVRGRGLDAELGGNLRLRGPITNVSPTGRFDLRRGRLEILSRRLDFDRGSIVLVGDLDPFLNFVANTRAGDVVATITVSGRPSDIAVSFSSSPSLPEDEVVALIVFGRSISELSPVQILRLANAVSELSGGQSAGIFTATRSLFGLDDLDIIDDGDGNVAVRAGTYINERVYLGVETGRETEATINLDITESLTARGSVSSDGESKIGIFFERDY